MQIMTQNQLSGIYFVGMEASKFVKTEKSYVKQ